MIMLKGIRYPTSMPIPIKTLITVMSDSIFFISYAYK